MLEAAKSRCSSERPMEPSADNTPPRCAKCGAIMERASVPPGFSSLGDRIFRCGALRRYRGCAGARFQRVIAASDSRPDDETHGLASLGGIFV